MKHKLPTHGQCTYCNKRVERAIHFNGGSCKIKLAIRDKNGRKKY